MKINNGEIVIPAHTEFQALVDLNLAKLVEDRQVAFRAEKAAKTLRENIDLQIMACFAVANAEKVMVGDTRVSKIEGRSPSSISSIRLLEKGVDHDVIEYATIAGKKYEYIKITEPKGA